MASIGNIRLELMARIGENEPHSLGHVSLPLTIESASSGTLTASVQDAAEYARVLIEKVFQEARIEEKPNDAR